MIRQSRDESYWSLPRVVFPLIRLFIVLLSCNLFWWRLELSVSLDSIASIDNSETGAQLAAATVATAGFKEHCDDLTVVFSVLKFSFEHTNKTRMRLFRQVTVSLGLLTCSDLFTSFGKGRVVHTRGKSQANHDSLFTLF